MLTQQAAKLFCTLRQTHAGTAIFIGDPCELRDELADGLVNLQVPAPNHVLLLALRSAADGHTNLNNGSTGLVVFEIQRHIALRVHLGDGVAFVVHIGLHRRCPCCHQ